MISRNPLMAAHDRREAILRGLFGVVKIVVLALFLFVLSLGSGLIQ